jgi:hypothetical protein
MQTSSEKKYQAIFGSHANPYLEKQSGDFIQQIRSYLSHCYYDVVLDKLSVFSPKLPYKLLVTTIPKSGSHLLIKALRNFRELKRRPIVLGPYLATNAYYEPIKNMAYNRFAWGHVGAEKMSLQLARDLDMVVIVMLRDPRDVVLSYVDHVYRLKPHILKNYYNSLPDDLARLKATIQGVPHDAYLRDPKLAEMGVYNRHPGFSDIGTVCRSYLAWLEYRDIHMVHFEDMIGEKGRGSRDQQLEEVKKLISFLNLKYTEDQAEHICSRVYDHKSPTFNLGIQARWKSVFTEEIKNIFKEVASTELIRMGYEKDDNW